MVAYGKSTVKITHAYFQKTAETAFMSVRQTFYEHVANKMQNKMVGYNCSEVTYQKIFPMF